MPTLVVIAPGVPISPRDRNIGFNAFHANTAQDGENDHLNLTGELQACYGRSS